MNTSEMDKELELLIERIKPLVANAKVLIARNKLHAENFKALGQEDQIEEDGSCSGNSD
jgi:hypothetical protein